MSLLNEPLDMFKVNNLLTFVSCRLNNFRVVHRRNLCRKIRRKHIRVLSPEDVANSKKLRNLEEVHDVVRDDEIDVSNEHGSPLPRFEKLKEMDPRLSKVLLEVKSKKSRKKSDSILLEGNRLISDAIKAGLSLKKLYFTKEEHLQEMNDHNDLNNVELYKVTYKHLKAWSDLTTFPGVMGIFKLADFEKLSLKDYNSHPINVICDNVREPGNLGVIIRSAAAAGCNKILLTKGCVDPWNSKVLRAGCGAHFRIPIISEVGWERLENYCSPDSAVLLADNTNLTSNDSHIQNLKNMLLEELQDKDPAANDYVFDESGQRIKIDDQYLNSSKLAMFKKIGIKSEIYSEVEIDTSKELNIVIGGETEGVSGAAYRFAHKFYGSSVHIPMEHGIESLNCSVASGIILFHVHKKYSSTNKLEL